MIRIAHQLRSISERSGLGLLAALGLLLAASWHPGDRLLPAVLTVLALVCLDRRGLPIAVAVFIVTILYHWETVAVWFGVFAYTLFFYSLIGLRSKRAAVAGFGFGAGVALLNLRWLVAEFDVHWAGLVLFIVACYAGIFMAAVAALLRCSLVRRPGWLGLSLTVLALPTLDYLRVAMPRFGTCNLYSGHLVVANVDLAQLAHWVGAGGLSALMAFCSYAAANWLAHERPTQWHPRIIARRTSRRGLLIVVALIIVLLGLGELDRYRSRLAPSSNPLTVAVVQSEDYASSLESYLKSSAPCDILFLPEGTISLGDWNDPSDSHAEQLMSLSDFEDRFAANINSFLVIGAMVKEQLGNGIAFRNAAISLDPNFNMLGQVDKQFGAPLVEVNPFQGIPILETIGARATHLSRRMNPQPNSAVLPIGMDLRAAVAICSEHQLPDIWSRRGVQDLTSINLQLVLSDVSWFDNSDEERDQSRLARRLLAAKYRRPLLYVASSGSELWDHTGNLLHSLASHASFAVWVLSIPQSSTHNSEWHPPDELWPLALFCGLFVCRWLMAGRRRRIERRNQ